MGVGKSIAQGAHAALNAIEISDGDDILQWKMNGSSKVVLAVYSEQELKDLILKANSKKLAAIYIRDAGRTELEPGTLTAGAIGPAKAEEIDSVTGHLKLL